MLLIGVMVPVQAWGESFLMRLASVAPQHFSYGKILLECVKEIEEKTGGRVKIATYFGGVLGDEPELAENFLAGEIEALVVAVPGPAIQKLFPELMVLAIPYLFQSRQEVDAVRRELFPTLAEIGRRRGVELILWLDGGFACYLSRFPIRTVDDLKRLKIWRWEHEESVRIAHDILGVTSVPLPLPEVPRALREGKIDVAYAPPFIEVVLGWHAETKYLIDMNFAYLSAALLARKDFYDRLPSGVARISAETARACGARINSHSWVDNDQAYNALIKAGLTPIRPREEVLEVHRALTDAIPKRLQGAFYPAELVAAVQNVIKKVRSQSPASVVP